jgi:hypothetical protein
MKEERHAEAICTELLGNRTCQSETASRHEASS